jgi:hypothetical protein
LKQAFKEIRNYDISFITQQNCLKSGVFDQTLSIFIFKNDASSFLIIAADNYISLKKLFCRHIKQLYF